MAAAQHTPHTTAAIGLDLATVKAAALAVGSRLLFPCWFTAGWSGCEELWGAPIYSLQRQNALVLFIKGALTEATAPACSI
jgi:hypothetical protein